MDCKPIRDWVRINCKRALCFFFGTENDKRIREMVTCIVCYQHLITSRCIENESFVCRIADRFSIEIPLVRVSTLLTREHETILDNRVRKAAWQDLDLSLVCVKCG